MSIKSAGSEICCAKAAHMLTEKKKFVFHSVVWGKKKELSAPVISVVLECMLLFSLQIFSLIAFKC